MPMHRQHAALIRKKNLEDAHPRLKIYPVSEQTWQADIRETGEQTIITKYSLDELCDRVDEHYSGKS